MTHSMKLSRLLYHFYDSVLNTDIEVTGLALDSRKVHPGDLFFAIKGNQDDGRIFIQDAIKKGAKVILEEVFSLNATIRVENGVSIFPFLNLRNYVGPIAAQFYGNPSQHLKIIGITGTNGKTSCSHFIAEALQNCALKSAIIGTLGTGLYGFLKEGSLTTPDPISLQIFLADVLKEKVQAVAMEVSSHSIDQGRINGIDFDIAIFTNLTRDHLDYHGTMENYGNTKRKLFDPLVSAYSLINVDDEFGQNILSDLSPETSFAYGLNSSAISLINRNRLVYADDIQLTSNGIDCTIHSPWGEGKVYLPLIGYFNLSNALATLGTLGLLQIPFSDAVEALGRLSSVPGRMQLFGGHGQPTVVVDFAHTPDALEKVLLALKQHHSGRILCLFGCGGDRDRGKRPLMGQIAEKYADYVLVTDDNPRNEDPKDIVKDIFKGFTNPDKIYLEHNRSKAINDIIQYANSNDCVLIAGKGAETYQQIGSEKIPFSDIQKVMESLDARLVK